MTADIIDFTTHHPKSRPATLVTFEDLCITKTPGTDDEPHKPLTTTAKNARLRSARWEVWRRADTLVNYWHALLKFTDAVSRAKRQGLEEALSHVETSGAERWQILDSYRDALGKHLLTPAPDVASVNWKRQRLSKSYNGVKKELVEKAIAEDIAFLNAHPARKAVLS
jgi:hypothetical protein